MSTTNVGGQFLAFSYLEEITSPNFNKTFTNILKTGIYAPLVANLCTVISGTSFTLNPFTAWLNSTNGGSVSVTTSSAITVPSGISGLGALSSSTPVFYMSYTHSTTYNSYLDFGYCASVNVLPTNAILICTLLFSGTTLTGFDYTNTTLGLLNPSGDIVSPTLIKAPQLSSTIATGTQPLVITSTTKVTNLNVDKIDDCDVETTVSGDTTHIPRSDAVKNLSSVNGEFRATRLLAYGSGAVSSNVAIGTQALNANTTGAYNVAIGDNALTSNSIGTNNIALGFWSLLSNTTGANNIAMGFGALTANQTGSNNVAIGLQALTANTGDDNIAIGTQTLFQNSTGGRNIAIGFTALQNNTIGVGNVAIGYGALNANQVGIENTAVGYKALLINIADGNTAFGHLTLCANITGTGNVAIGGCSLQANTNGQYNTAVGYNALKINSTNNSNTAIGYGTLQKSKGNVNTAVGYNALQNNTTGVGNVAIGSNTLSDNTTGLYNVAVGTSALKAVTNIGSHNTGVGYSAGNNITTGLNNICIGSNTQVSSAAASNEVVLGDNSITSFRCQGIYAATSASAANVYVDSTGKLFRSTSTLKYKKDIEDVLPEYTSKIYDFRPIWYRSTAKDSNENYSYWGLLAEEVELIDPRFVSYGYEDEDYEEKNGNKILKTEAIKKPVGVQYERLTVFLIAELKNLKKEINILKGLLA